MRFPDILSVLLAVSVTSLFDGAQALPPNYEDLDLRWVLLSVSYEMMYLIPTDLELIHFKRKLYFNRTGTGVPKKLYPFVYFGKISALFSFIQENLLSVLKFMKQMSKLISGKCKM